MKEKLTPIPNKLPDGSLNFGNGIIGPSLKDQEHSNLLTIAPKELNRIEEGFVREGLVPVSWGSRFWKAIEDRLKPQAKYVLPITAALTMLTVSCADKGGKTAVPKIKATPTTSESGATKTPEKVQNYPMILPIEGPSYLTNGPHAWNNDPNGIKNSLDFAPRNDNQNAIASVSGEIVAIQNPEDPKNPKDRYHSIVRIKDEKTGNIIEEMHLKAIISKNVGDKINQGEVIGKPSSESPPGGSVTEGNIVHLSLYDANGNPIPISGRSFSGWKVNNDTMTKPGEEKRTATVYHYDSGEGRNDLNQEPIKAVLGATVGAEKSPNPQISGKANEESVSVTPTTKQETSVPKASEKAPEQGYRTWHSINYPYKIDIPSEWSAESKKSQTEKLDVIRGDSYSSPIDVFGRGPQFHFEVIMYISNESVENFVNVDDYAENRREQINHSVANEPAAILDAPQVYNTFGMFVRGKQRNELETEIQRIQWDLMHVDKVAGKKAHVINYLTIPQNDNIPPRGLVFETVFIANNYAWNIKYFGPPSFSGKEIDRVRETSLINYQKILSSFKFIK